MQRVIDCNSLHSSGNVPGVISVDIKRCVAANLR